MSSDQKYSIAKFDDVKKRVNDLNNRSDDIKSRLASTLKGLWNVERSLRFVSDKTNFNDLRTRFPHFEEVINFYENNVITLAKLNLPFEAPPALLLGDPGLGKTYFASELAKLIKLSFSEISLATATSAFTLSGGSIQWSEGEPGFVSKTLANSKVANPIVLIDEIDKALSGSSYNPMNVFYSLLESHSSKSFRDEALEFNIDASKIIWIATGNDVNDIPAPIQSRMRVFEIKQPSIEAMRQVVASIYSYLISTKSYGKLLNKTLGEDVLVSLARNSPRFIRIALEEAAFKAIRNDSSIIQVKDLPNTKKEQKRVGFI